MTRWKWVLPLVLGFHAADAVAGWFDEASLDMKFDRNLSHAQLPEDIKSDLALRLFTTSGTEYQLTDHGRVSLNLALSGSVFQRYHGLDNINAGLELGYHWKFGLGHFVPELYVSGAATRNEYQNTLRTGWLYAGEVGFAKRLSNRLHIRTAFREERSKSDSMGDRFLPNVASDAFNLTIHNLIFGGDYAIAPEYIFSATYSLRKGDIISTANEDTSLPIALAARAIVEDPVFGSEMYVYKMKALTHVASMSISRLIGEKASFSFGYEYLDSHAEGGIAYRTTQLRLTYLYQF